MTSDTTPSGVASASNSMVAHPAYHAFDDSDTTYWGTNSVKGIQYIQYEFPKIVTVEKIELIEPDCSGTQITLESIEASTDGTTWQTIYNEKQVVSKSNAPTQTWFEFNKVKCNFIKMNLSRGSSYDNIYATKFQCYGH